MSVPTYLDNFAQRSAAVLGGGFDVSITLRYHGATLRAASSTAASARCDHVETRTGEGPCIDAMDELTTQLVPDIGADHRWLAWRDQSLDEGYVSAVAVPAFVYPGIAIALNTYSTKPDPWNESVLVALDGYAQLVATAVGLHLQTTVLEEQVAGLYAALDTAQIIERAVGAIMYCNSCTADEARDLITTACHERNVTERHVAETLLAALISPGDRRELKADGRWAMGDD